MTGAPSHALAREASAWKAGMQLGLEAGQRPCFLEVRGHRAVRKAALPPLACIATAPERGQQNPGGGLDLPLVSAAGAGNAESLQAEKQARRGHPHAVPWRNGGRGGRRWVRSANPVAPEDGALADFSQIAGPSSATEGELPAEEQRRLTWLSEQGLELSTERTLWRVNRTISRCATVKEALAVVEEMKAAGLNAANEGTYVALITVCRRQKQGDRALIVYEAMKQAGVKPGMLTFNSLISCCQQAQRLEDAFRLKTDMEAVGLMPDVVTYTSLMALVVRTSPYRGRSSPAQRFSRAMDLYREMMQRGVTPDAITYNTLLYAGAQAKLPGKVLEVYGMMIVAGVPPNQFTFGILLEAVGHGGRLKAALQVFNEMKAAGIPPSTSTFNFLIEACGTAPQPDFQAPSALYGSPFQAYTEAERLVVELYLMGRHCSAVVPAIALSYVQSEKAWALYEEMEAQPGVRVNAETMHNLITACCKAEDHERALKAFDLMKSKNFLKAIKVSTYNKLIHCASCAQRAEKAFELYNQMRQENHQPDVITFGTLVTACATDGDVPRAAATWQEMESLGIQPNRVAYHALIGLYGKVGDWEKCIEAFRRMQAECRDEPATGASYNILLDALMGKCGAEAAVRDAVEKGEPLHYSPAIAAAVDFYREASSTGALRSAQGGSSSMEADLARLDLRYTTRTVAVVAILDWVLRVKEMAINKGVTARDLVIVTGSISKNQAVSEPRGRFPKLFVCAEKTLQALGLRAKPLRTLTLQALTVTAEDLTSCAWGQQSSMAAQST